MTHVVHNYMKDISLTNIKNTSDFNDFNHNDKGLSDFFALNI